MCLQAVINDPRNIEFVPFPGHPTPVLIEVREDSRTIYMRVFDNAQHKFTQAQIYTLCLSVIEKDVSNLKFIPVPLLTEELFTKALRIDPFVLKFLPTNHISDKLWGMSVTNNSLSIKLAPHEIRLKHVEKNSRLLYYFSIDDRLTILYAIFKKYYGKAKERDTWISWFEDKPLLNRINLLLATFLIPWSDIARHIIFPRIAEYIDPNEFACNSIELLPDLVKMAAVSSHTKIDSKMLTADAKVSTKTHRSGA